MALSADTPRTYGGTLRESAQPMQASVTFYAGAVATRDSNGEVGPCLGTETFAGFCRKGTTNGSTAGAANVALYDQGEVELTITGLDDNDDIGDIVYASDDTTFTLTASGSCAIGRVRQIVDLTAGKAIVAFHADTMRDQVLA